MIWVSGLIIRNNIGANESIVMVDCFFCNVSVDERAGPKTERIDDEEVGSV